jgi:hypothetical protein
MANVVPTPAKKMRAYEVIKSLRGFVLERRTFKIVAVENLSVAEPLP